MTTRIAHVVTTFYETNVVGFVLALAADQRRHGCQVELAVGRNASPELLAAKRSEGLVIHQVPALRKYLRPCHEGQALLALYRLFRRRGYQVVHTHLAKAGVLGRLAARLAQVPRVIHSVYGATFGPSQFWGRRVLFRGLERLAGRSTDAFIFVGRELMEAYARAGVCPREKGRVINVGKDLSPFLEVAALSPAERRRRRRELGFRDQDIVLGNVSRIVPLKGHDYALEVFASLKSHFPTLKLALVGDAKTPSEQAFKNRLLKSIRGRSLEKDIIITGWTREPARYFAAFDLYLSTSLAPEGLPETFVEAAATGVPVVGFDCYGVREIPGVKATLVPSRNVPALTAVLRREIEGLIAAPGQGNGSPHGGQPPEILRELCRKFDKGKMVRQSWEVYHQLLGN